MASENKRELILGVCEAQALMRDALESRYMPPDQQRKILLHSIRALRPAQRKVTVAPGFKVYLPKATNDQLKSYAEYLLSEIAADDSCKSISTVASAIVLHEYSQPA
jgi:hypothetical protein